MTTGEYDKEAGNGTERNLAESAREVRKTKRTKITAFFLWIEQYRSNHCNKMNR